MSNWSDDYKKTQAPLRWRLPIREVWGSPENQAILARENLSNGLGIPVEIEIDWDSMSTNNVQIVEALIDFVASFSREIQESCEYDEDRAMAFLERVGPKLKIIISCPHVNFNRPDLKWSPDYQGVVSVFTAPTLHRKDPRIVDALVEKLLQGSSGTEATQAPPLEVPASRSATSGSVLKPSTPLTLSKLSPPRELFNSKPPYTMMVTIYSTRLNRNYVEEGISCIEINGSHEPALVLMKDYFVKNVTVDSVRGRPARPLLEIELHKSHLVHSSRDLLTIQPITEGRAGVRISPALVINFIEGTLKYKYQATVGGSLMYRSDSPLVV